MALLRAGVAKSPCKCGSHTGIHNGFDIAHHLPTNYAQFKYFLFNHYCKGFNPTKITSNIVPPLPITQIHSNKYILRDVDAECCLLYWLIEKAAMNAGDIEWNQFEALLDYLDFDSILEKYGYQENTVSILAGTLDTLEEAFFAWIKTIEVSEKISPIKYFKDIVSTHKSLVISFNYTETIETVYGIAPENVCYVHGKRDDLGVAKTRANIWGKDNKKLIIGHDGSRCKHQYELSKSLSSSYKSSALISLYAYMAKDSNGIVYENRDFFKQIAKSNISNIYSFGYSYSSVDTPQIKAICDAINEKDTSSDIVWHLHIFDNKKKNQHYKRIIRQLGFKGHFATYGCI